MAGGPGEIRFQCATCETGYGALSLAGGLMILALVSLASGSGMTFTAFLLALPLLITGTLHLACSVGPALALLVHGQETQAKESGQWVFSCAT